MLRAKESPIIVYCNKHPTGRSLTYFYHVVPTMSFFVFSQQRVKFPASSSDPPRGSPPLKPFRHLATFLVPLLLYSLAFLTVVSHPVAALDFRNVTKNTQFDYFGSVGELEPQVATMFVDNEGVYASDIDNDHRSELLLLGGEELVLYEYTGSHFRRTHALPSLEKTKYNAAVFTDVDKDGFRDLVLVPQSGHILLLKNDGGSFRIARKFSKPNLRAGIGATAGDFNGDGCPDVLVLQYGPGSTRTPKKQKQYRYGAQFRNLENDNGHRNHLLTGDCSTLEHDPRPVFDRRHWSLAGSFVDVSGNGLTDIHVANDFYRDSLYVAQSDGSFHHRYLGPFTSRNGMSSTVTDFNQDGSPDLFVSNIHLPETSQIFERQRFITRISADPDGHNALINKGKGNFVDRAEEIGVRTGGWGWAAVWADLTNNFSPELLQGLQNHLAVPPSARQMNLSDPNVKAFLNDYYNHRPIPPSTQSSHPYFDEFKYWVGYPNVWSSSPGNPTSYGSHPISNSEFGRLNARGLTTLDYDLDGDLDVAVAQFLNSFRIFRNETNSRSLNRSNWIKVHFEYPELGGRLLLERNGDSLTRPVTSRTDYASQQPATYHVGIGKNDLLDQLKILDHGIGSPRTVRDLPARSLVIVGEDDLQIFAGEEWIPDQ